MGYDRGDSFPFDFEPNEIWQFEDEEPLEMGGVAGGRKRLFAKELRCMMFGFGDDHNPYTESVDMLEDIVLEFIIQMVRPQPLRALSTLRGLRGAPAVPPLCRETQSLGQQMLGGHEWVNKLLHRECGHAGGYCAGIHRADGEKMKYLLPFSEYKNSHL